MTPEPHVDPSDPCRHSAARLLHELGRLPDRDSSPGALSIKACPPAAGVGSLGTPTAGASTQFATAPGVPVTTWSGNSIPAAIKIAQPRTGTPPLRRCRRKIHAAQTTVMNQ